ncbi:ribonuclease E inhibitor RraB [Phaeobacter sp. NW0010-22]|uniref:ribonuclease E inhibitor RraB n=1 Tax=Phaeobacter sp. NW0010-22 TaxID=3135907 RepID=UPI00310516CF
MSHDFPAQRAETLSVYSDLQAKHGLPDIADVDFFFVPVSESSDWRPLAEHLSNDGYECQYVTAQEKGDAPYLVATLSEQIISASAIWISEEVATRAALEHGFRPDGWGLEG